MRTAYLDASAVVKLVFAERESDALRATLADADLWISSAILEVEVRCAVRRAGREDLLAQADATLDRIGLIEPGPEHRRRAGEAFDPPQRALDALHLATALRLPGRGIAFLTYDEAQALAAEAAGLDVLTPV